MAVDFQPACFGCQWKVSASGFLLLKENHGYASKFVTLPFSVIFKKRFLTTYSESSSVLTRRQSLQTNGRSTISQAALGRQDTGT